MEKIKKFNLIDFADFINNYENFAKYDNVINYYIKNKLDESQKARADIYIQYFIETIFYDKNLEINFWDLKELLAENYEQEVFRYEFTDGQIDIYNINIYKSCEIFADYVEDYKDEFWELPDNLAEIIQKWQWQAYNELNNMIWDLLVEYCETNL